jgi:LPXTG-motif cell wall-anchored protein
LPVQIVQGSEVIKDFGTVTFHGDKTFSASVSFPVDDCPVISPTPELCNGSGGSDNDDGSGAGDPNSSGSNGAGSGSSSGSPDGGSGNLNSGAVDSGFGSAGSSSGGVPDDIANGLRGLLPSTGGSAALWVLGAGVLLVAGGLLVRKAFR